MITSTDKKMKCFVLVMMLVKCFMMICPSRVCNTVAQLVGERASSNLKPVKSYEITRILTKLE